MIVALVACAAAAAATATSDTLPLGRELRVSLTGGRELFLEIKPWPDEDLPALARRIAPASVRGDLLTASLADRRTLTEDGFYRVPFALLGPDARVLVLRTVFPDDRADGA